MTKVKKKRPTLLNGGTYMETTGCGDLFVTINEDSEGPFEIFLRMGKAGGCASCQAEAIGRLVSLSFRLGGSSDQLVKQLEGISCHQPAGLGAERVTSCADAVAKALIRHRDKK